MNLTLPLPLSDFLFFYKMIRDISHFFYIKNVNVFTFMQLFLF
jgi:hypothetical protein